MKKILVQNENEVLNALKEGKRVNGRLKMETGEDGKCVICFKAYNCKPRTRTTDRLLLNLEHGWVKESKQRIKVLDSLPKAIGPVRMVDVLKREMKCASELVKNLNVNLN